MKEKVGYPWTTLPDTMFVHAGQGYAGHGTLCGTLGVSSCVINLVLYDEKQTYSTRREGRSKETVKGTTKPASSIRST